MKLGQLGEFGLIEAIERATPKGRGVRLGIGDDAAWVSHPRQSSLVTSDLLIEGIHFDFRWTTMVDLGFKTLAVNMSDIAAMGGVPAYLILSLGIPAHFDAEKITDFYRGVHSLAKPHNVALIGGDTNLAPVFIVCACVIGHPPVRPITRSGASVGDDIYLTGTLGDAALALDLLRQARTKKNSRFVGPLLERHHRPTARLAAGALLARKGLATAMIDVSDGLLQDLGHICKASGVGAVVFKDRIPLSRAYRALCTDGNLDYALSGGEDYELLFCARAKDRARIEKLRRSAEVAITHIGHCVSSDKRISVVDDTGKTLALKGKGHDHFKSRAAQTISVPPLRQRP